MSNDCLPAFSERNVPIVLASSAYYAPYMAVTIQSIIDTAGDLHNYDIIIFGNQIAEEDRQLIISQSLGKSNISIRFVNVDNETERINYNFREGYAVESFYRVLLMELLPQYDKVIYLDSDVVVKKDLAILFEHDLQGYLVAAARDPDGIKCYYQNYKNRAIYMDEVLGLDVPECYFQSGVMLFNLEKDENNRRSVENCMFPKIAMGGSGCPECDLQKLCFIFGYALEYRGGRLWWEGQGCQRVGQLLGDRFVFGCPSKSIHYTLCRCSAVEKRKCGYVGTFLASGQENTLLFRNPKKSRGESPATGETRSTGCAGRPRCDFGDCPCL